MSKTAPVVPTSMIIDAIADAVITKMSSLRVRKSEEMTVGQLFDRWMQDYAKQHLQERTWRNYDRMFRSYFSTWHNVPIYDVARAEVQTWQAGLADSVGPTTANRARELMRMIYNKGLQRDLISDNHNPATNLRKYKTQARERFLQADELPRMFAALQTLRYDATRDCLLMCLLTAQRVGNVRTMRWTEIDFQRKVWTIARTKNGTSHIVPLTADAMVILNGRRPVMEKSEWVFPNHIDPAKPITKLEKGWREARNRAGLPDVRIHDLRRTHASWQALNGESTLIIAKTLNHNDLNSTAIYGRLNVDRQRLAMSRANSAMLKAAGARTAPEDEATVTELGPGFELREADPWITEVEAANIVGLSRSRLEYMRHSNEGPPYLKMGHSVRYKESMLRAWLHGRKPHEGRKVNGQFAKRS